METVPLQAQLRHFARRLLAIGVASGLGWGLAAAILLLVVCVWLDLLWELPPAMRVACAAAAAAVIGLLVLAAGWLARRHSEPNYHRRQCPNPNPTPTTGGGGG